MPRAVLRKAQGIAIVPDMFKMSFIFGARFGKGVLVVRQPDGTWSNPIFIHLLGGSFGAQAGAQSTDLVLVFQSQKGLNRFLKGKGKLTLGVDAGVAAGPAGKRFEASTDAALKSEILSYSNSHGIFAGVSAEGGTLQIDHKSNAYYYHQPVPPGAILASNSALAVPPSTLSLQKLLSEKTALPERIVSAGRSRKAPVVVNGGPILDDADGIEIDGAIRRDTLADPAPSSSRSAPRREVRPQAEPDIDDELDAVPAPLKNKKSSGNARRPQPNDEDLPQAMPEPAAPKRQPSSARPPRQSEDDDVPDLSPPHSR